MRGGLRWALAASEAFVSATALAGGSVLIASALVPGLRSSWAPPTDYLDGSPFSSYLVPGFALLVFLGLLQAAACVLVLRRSRLATVVATAAGFAALVWIFVQMMYIPFSLLQAAYFAVGLGQLAVILVQLGLFATLRRPSVGLSVAAPDPSAPPPRRA